MPLTSLRDPHPLAFAGEMADADFGYVGGAPGKIDLYVGKEVVRRGIPMESVRACAEAAVWRAGGFMGPWVGIVASAGVGIGRTSARA